MDAMAVSGRNYRYVARPIGYATPVVIAALIFSVVSIGWLQSEEGYLTPKNGLGYWLGIVGSLMMLALLTYSYRKRSRATRGLFSIPTWFRIHMVLGALGPSLILFHSNFSLGALNSNVALFTMLAVATSGVIGRYIYGKIHIGLHGRRAVAKEIFADVDELRRELAEEMRGIDTIFADLDLFGRQILEHDAQGPAHSHLLNAITAVRSRLQGARKRRQVLQAIETEGRRNGWALSYRRQRIAEIDLAVSAYLNAVLKAAELRFFERLFSLWHVLHLPLFFLMVMAALVHVWATHRY